MNATRVAVAAIVIAPFIRNWGPPVASTMRAPAPTDVRTHIAPLQIGRPILFLTDSHTVTVKPSQISTLVEEIRAEYSPYLLEIEALSRPSEARRRGGSLARLRAEAVRDLLISKARLRSCQISLIYPGLPGASVSTLTEKDTARAIVRTRRQRIGTCVQ
jgi:hypothetical protein